LHLARTLANLGARVIVADAAATNPSAVDTLRAAGGDAHFIPTDLDSNVSLAQLAAEVERNWGPAEVVIWPPLATFANPLLSLSVAEWDAIVTHSLRRAYITTQMFLSGFVSRGSGTLLSLVVPEIQPGLAVVAAVQNGLLAFHQALAAEFRSTGVRVLTLALRLDTPAEDASRAAARLLLAPDAPSDRALVHVDEVLAWSGGDSTQAAGKDPAAHLMEAIALSQQLAGLLLDTDAEFDRLPVGLRPMARGNFMSKVGYRSQDVLRAVSKLSDQLQRLQASHSGTDTEFSVDYPLLVNLLERLRGYYQSFPDDLASPSPDQAHLSHLHRQMSERQALVHNLLLALAAVHE
jgi:NAD(P)-dependent dehydrogenase (short-subunit alcohol dehydrogenase family)